MKIEEVTCPNCGKFVLVSDKLQNLLFTDNPKIIGIVCKTCSVVLSKEYVRFNIYQRMNRKRR